ncbi:hypothetical protein NADFUDRAFT_44936 [Nadsonia fulvescens var. elongata DSM 6958]|uniref:Uncharacterized protein n=1 Tax=Nadsonia fulvescens var. elongata DSM 6958 TaxID=857566 RepID=A0A1E3PSD5_9ASCO|nr:hypothetical protein NADFUDRAFT_44936 [Nadsonia fulvescens var. elongata DSM 6958]
MSDDHQHQHQTGFICNTQQIGFQRLPPEIQLKIILYSRSRGLMIQFLRGHTGFSKTIYLPFMRVLYDDYTKNRVSSLECTELLKQFKAVSPKFELN